MEAYLGLVDVQLVLYRRLCSHRELDTREYLLLQLLKPCPRLLLLFFETLTGVNVSHVKSRGPGPTGSVNQTGDLGGGSGASLPARTQLRGVGGDQWALPGLFAFLAPQFLEGDPLK